ncbi:MAG: heavy metal translocating P-type ATPase, partial [Ruminococcus sp.]|nr:heavy metal translocating P-type ATPase [Ruminococcus sp.]
MKQYSVTGMTCAACSARVEKAVSAVKGVTSCSVSLLTNSMGVEGTASDSDIIKAVQDSGYGIFLKGSEKSQATDNEDTLKDRETPVLKKRLISSIGFLIVLMYMSMGYSMWGFSLPSFMDGNYIMLGIIQMLLAGIIMVINQKFFISGFKSLFRRSPNMDTLVALGSGTSFVYSLWTLLAMTDAQLKGLETMHYMHDFYFESAGMILVLITVGKMLEARSKGKTTDALKSLMKLAPKTAVIIENGEEKSVPVEQVKKGDIFVVRPGENIAVDGIIIEGESAVNESALTGESIPVDKTAGDSVSAATLNQSGFIKCEATRVGEDTTLSQIIQMVSDAAATKAPIAKVADKVSGIFVPAVIGIALITFIIWLIVGQTVGYSLARAISVLVISCPCALGLATPVAIMVGNGVGAKNGILFKTAVSLEETGKINVVALDKTGTITSGEPKVTDIITTDNTDEKYLLSLAYALERKSEHPLAKAILSKAEEEKISAEEVTEFKALSGNGLEAFRNDVKISGGNYSFISTVADIPENMKEVSEKLSENGKTRLFCYLDLFSTFQYYVLLNDDYEGEEISETYAQRLIPKGQRPDVSDYGPKDLSIVMQEYKIDKSGLEGKCY